MKQFSDTFYIITLYRLPVIAFILFIFWQSSGPGMITQPLFPHFDKVLHFGAYALLAFLAARNLKKERPLWPAVKIKIIAIIFAGLFGLSDEIHQSFIPLRDASLWDFIADCAGSIAGAFFYMNFIYHFSGQHDIHTADHKT